MRWFELISEGVNKYLPLYNGIPPQHPNDIATFVLKLENFFKRDDRVTWFVRWHRIWYASQVMEKAAERKIESGITDKTLRRLAAAVSPTLTFEQVVKIADDEVMHQLLNFKHYIDMPIPAIQNLRWEKQMPIDLIREMAAIETAWREEIESQKGNTVRLRGNEDVVIDFKNGWVWFNLNRPSCNDEADAMGHCGNGGSRRNETILSLRKRVTDDLWTPHLTFIRDDAGLLGEMKGRANQNPVAKYHPYIIALLKHDIVEGIKGGGYMPENNFSLDDLPDNIANELTLAKPGLADLASVFTDYRKEKAANNLSEMTKQLFETKLLASLYNYEYDSVDFEKEYIIVNVEKRPRYVLHSGMVTETFDDLFSDDILSKLITDTHAYDEDEAEIIQQMVEEQYYKSVFDYCLTNGDQRQYEIVAVNWDQETDLITKTLDFYSFCYAEEGQLESLEANELDAVARHLHYSDFDIDEMPDPVADTLWQYSMRKNMEHLKKDETKQMRDAAFVRELLGYLKPDLDKLFDDGQNDRVAVHPDQIGFDFD